ncbi:MAG: tannase/feruloyl esterase family alpha/beta hydrolase [Elusimicrobia bacterium]|nr:tannase/feruloyl esterase family alpha/beta hydrolase [Elusimicrobiota bacterium]
MSRLRVFAMRVDLPRAPLLKESARADLTTAPERAAGTLPLDALHVAPPKARWTKLDRPAPGTLVEGTLPPDHFARFVLRLPEAWNGRLVVAAASGITDERTYDLYVSDYALSKGYAFAATDKGVRRATLDGDTVLMPFLPENSVRRWASRLETLAALAKEKCASHYGRAPEKTYAFGLSNGGFLARRAAEEGFVDGAVDVSGVLWRAETGNLLRELPVALRATANVPWDRQALERASFPRGDSRWDPLIAFYRAAYWEAVMLLFLGDLDPEYSGEPQDYDLDARPMSVREAIASFANTGDLKVPLISISGRRDYLISCAGHAEPYRDLVASRGKAALHRLEIMENASHIDTNAEMFPLVEPLMERGHAALDALAARVEGRAPAAR